jgi:hypothetical protein
LDDPDEPRADATRKDKTLKKTVILSGAKNPRISPEAPQKPHSSPNRSGKKGKTKSKTRDRNKKTKGKRK